MDIFHLAPPHKMKGKDSKPFNTFFPPSFFYWNESDFFFLAHYHSLIRKSSLQDEIKPTHPSITKLQHVSVLQSPLSYRAIHIISQTHLQVRPMSDYQVQWISHGI